MNDEHETGYAGGCWSACIAVDILTSFKIY